jgi:acyl-CoA reductase-like NAD-dependent aldehyde dehydrogenase
VFAVHASGNAPGVHALWPQALALGYRVAVRPSRREPFTGHRLVHALRQSGFRDHDVMFLPTDYAGADELIDAADLAMVYGGQDIVDKYADDPTVFVNGPGRTKILLTEDRDWRDYLDMIVDSIAHLGGMACVNATAVLCEGDATELAHAIADRLATIVPLPITDERAVLPTQPLAKAQALADYVAMKASSTTPVLGADGIVADLGDGHAALRPALHLLSRPDVEVLNVELPFPCVWVSAWSRDDGLAPLRGSLVVNAVTGDEDLIDRLIAEPSVANVYSGRHPTYYTGPGIPHDGFLAEFLMRCKGFARD